MGGTREIMQAKLCLAPSECLGKGGHQPSPYLLVSWSLQLWVEERLPLALSDDYGINLQTVQLFMKKNQVSPASPLQASLLPQGGKPSADLQKASNIRPPPLPDSCPCW